MNDISISELFGWSKKTDVQDTSIKAYNEIKVDGTVNRQEKQILNCMQTGEDYSLQELSHITGIAINAVSGRCNSLKKKEIIRCNPKRKCSLTGKTIKPLTLN